MPLIMCADAEEAEERYEAIHGPIMYAEYGVTPPEGPFHADALHEEARDLDGALDKLDGLIGDAADEHIARAEGHPDAAALPARWEAFAEQVTDTASRDGWVQLTGPDGWSYWAGAIDRS